MEGRILVEGTGGGITAVGLLVLESIELRISLVLTQQRGIGDGRRGVVAEQPDSGMARTL